MATNVFDLYAKIGAFMLFLNALESRYKRGDAD